MVKGKKPTQRKQVVEKMAALATAAFGLVAALAWNDAIKKLFEQFFGQQTEIWAMFAYATIVTIIAVLVTLYLGKLAHKEEE